jgi:predicted secreted protein
MSDVNASGADDAPPDDDRIARLAERLGSMHDARTRLTAIRRSRP